MSQSNKINQPIDEKVKVRSEGPIRTKFKFRWRDQLTIPNFLTLLRLIAIPFMAYFLYNNERYPYFGIVFFAAIWCTDMLDGYIARHFNQVSDLGKLFDPAVDKLFHFVTGVVLCLTGRVPLWVPILIAVKELIMAIGALILLHLKIVVYAHWIGKVATVLYVAAFATVMLLPDRYLYLNNLIFIPPTICSYLALLHYSRFHINYWRQKRSG